MTEHTNKQPFDLAQEFQTELQRRTAGANRKWYEGGDAMDEQLRLQQVGKELRTVRKLRNISTENLARRMAISEFILLYLECGLGELDEYLKWLPLWAEYLDLPKTKGNINSWF